MAAGSPVGLGPAATWPTRARASATAVKVYRSKASAPFTVCTRLGTRSVRRW